MGWKRVTCAVTVTLIPLIVFLALLNSVVVPNYHGSRFKIGKCQIKSVEVRFDQASWKDCSCGVTCTAQFPCVSILGDYTSYGENTISRNGSFHSDYSALAKKCFTIPECNKDPTANEESVKEKVDEFYSHDLLRFNCWALGDKILTHNGYSAKRASLALFLPLLFFILGLMILIKTSRKVRSICNKCCCELIPRCSKQFCSCLEHCCAGCVSKEDIMIRVTSVSDQPQFTKPSTSGAAPSALPTHVLSTPPPPSTAGAAPSAPPTHVLSTPPPPYTEQHRTVL